MQVSEKMTPTELRATVGLASIYGLRMLGMFLILPIFAVYAQQLKGSNQSLIGLALGAYGLSQVLLQLPFGLASDRYGRKRLIYIGLTMFALGSVIAALAQDIYLVIWGRAIQGAGAISAVVTALVADSTREEHRTKAMAMIGATIGLTFACSLVAGPILNRWIGVSGIFWMTGVLSLLAMLVVKFGVPDPLSCHFHSDAQTAPKRIKDVVKDTQLLRLNFGTFCLHGAQMAMFVVVPFALTQTRGLDVNHHWQIYLPVLIVSFLLMIPAIVYAEKRAKLKPVFIVAVALMLIAQLAFAFSIHQFWGIVVSLLVYFVAFNILEASLPSLISKMAPAASKGTAMGVHNTAQSFGMFVGGTTGGVLSHHIGFSAVFWFCALLMLVWLGLAFGMKTPPSVKTKMYHIELQDANAADAMVAKIAGYRGVHEVIAIADEHLLIVKMDNQQSNEAQLELEQAILKLIGSE